MLRSNREMPPARGTKTLAWFMDNDILKNGENASGEQGATGRRGSSSDESKTATPSSAQHNFYTQQLQNPQQKKYKKFRKTLSGHGAARKEGFTSSQAMSESSEDGCAPILPPSGGATSSGGASAPGAEEYWFYDVATDGYYYEQNGAKGWRRRQPNAAVHKGGKDQEVAHMNVNGPSKYNQLLAAQAAAAQAAFLQHAFQLQQQQSQMVPPTPPPSNGPPGAQNPTMRYYDPSSDGFFYEMASVDGWKRRQPNKPVSASVPAGITRPYSQRQADLASGALPRHPQQPTSSYGAALARGQFPRNTVKQQPDAAEVLSTTPTTTTESARGDSTASSICGDSNTFAEFFNPMIQRPSALNLEKKAVSPQAENVAMNSTAALFDAMLADLNGGEKKTPLNFNTYTMAPPPQSSQSPMKESWNSFRSCSLFSPIKPSKRVISVGNQNQAPMGTPMIDDMVDDDTMKMLMRDLDKLWANTPVSGLNQA